MASITVNGRRVTVSDNFMSLSPEDQDATVDEIAQSMGETPAPQPAAPQDGGSAIGAGIANFAQGATFGLADEAKAGIKAIDDTLLGGTDPNASFGQNYDKRLTETRGDLKARTEAHPVASVVGGVAGAVAPALLTGGATGPTSMGSAIPRAAVMSGLSGGAQAAGEAEGGLGPRLKAAAVAAPISAGLGAGASLIIGKVAGAVGKRSNAAALTVDGLERAKRAAYDAVEQSGDTVPAQLIQQAAKDVRDDITNSFSYLPEVSGRVEAALDKFDTIAGRDLTIGQLDEFRKGLSQAFNETKKPQLLDLIDKVDEVIATSPAGGDLQLAARAANAKFKKAELIERAFKKADDQVSSKGSGGDVLNSYRKVATRIINDPKQAKWFDDEEKAALQKIIDGGVGEDILRRIGKLSPSGNGLMLMLNVMATGYNPLFLGVGALGAGAKALADRSASGNVDNLMERVVGPAAVSANNSPRNPAGVNALAGYLGSSFSR